MEKIEYKGYTIEIVPDDCPMNPREDDNLGTMVCFHDRYSLGDKHIFKTNDYNSWDDFLKGINDAVGKVIALPLYLYDHSGITIATKPFGCRWDSGQVGFIFCSYDKIREEYGKKRISKQLLEKVKSCLEAEVEVYDKYLRGDFCGYIIKEKNDEDELIYESCFGFEDEEGAVMDAKQVIDHAIKEE